MRAAAVRGGFEALAGFAFAATKVELAIVLGDLADAMSWANRSRLVGRESRTWVELALIGAILALEAGTVDDATRALDDIESASGRFEDPGWIPLARAVLAARLGDHAEVASHLSSLQPSSVPASILVWATRDLLGAGVEPDTIRELATDDGAGRGGRIIGHRGGTETLEALLAVAEGHTDADALVDAARQVEHERLDTTTKTGHLGVVHRAELELAAAELALTRKATAHVQSHATAAARLLERWPGARRDHALALARSDESDAGDRGGLTGRELDVARLVALGMTNGEIAQQLYISRKTVSTHVSHILAKLGMRSRTEVAVWAADEGLALAATA